MIIIAISSNSFTVKGRNMAGFYRMDNKFGFWFTFFIMMSGFRNSSIACAPRFTNAYVITIFTKDAVNYTNILKGKEIWFKFTQHFVK